MKKQRQCIQVNVRCTKCIKILHLMEENENGGAGGGGTGTRTYIWWALASAAQLGWAISSFKRGHTGDSHFMPFKTFSVPSLFVGATATAVVSVLHVSGIHKVYFSLSLCGILGDFQSFQYQVKAVLLYIFECFINVKQCGAT